MKDLEREQKIQEESYEFPYHYIPTYDNRNFSQVRTLRRGYEYLSYLFFVIKQIEPLQFNSLLDIGCGDGKFLHEVLHRFPGKKLVGLDYSEKAINLAKALNPGIEYICADITTTKPLEDQYDIITSIDTLEHIPPANIKLFVESLHYNLKDGGNLILTVPSNNVRVTGKHYQHFDLEWLDKTLNPFFTISKWMFLNRISRWNKLLRWILGNKFFILNNKHLLNLLYRSYEKYLLHANEKNGKRIYARCEKNCVSI